MFQCSHWDRPNIPNLAIVVTDGVPFPPDRRTPALDEARTLRDTGASVISIGITDAIDEDFLKGMSSAPQLLGQNYFTATDFGVLNEIQKTVVEGTCETLEGEFLPQYSCIVNFYAYLHIVIFVCDSNVDIQLFILNVHSYTCELRYLKWKYQPTKVIFLWKFALIF